MSGYPHGFGGMGGGIPPPPSIPPRPAAYRQGSHNTYYTQENSEAPAWRIPYQETEVSISVVETTPATSDYTNPSRNPSIRKPENHAIDNRYNTHNSYSAESEAGVSVSHNMVVEPQHTTETQVYSDGMSEGLTALGHGVSFYDTTRPTFTPAQAPPVQPRTEYEPAADEKIFIDHSDYFAPPFQQSPAQLTPQSQTYSQLPELYSPAPNNSYGSNNSRPPVPHAYASDPFPISVEHERYSSEQNNIRESQFPEPVNLGGTDLFFQPSSVHYPSYRRTPRRPVEESAHVPTAGPTGLPSLDGILGPAGTNQGQPPQPRHSFDDEKRFYPNNYNGSSISLLSTQSDNVLPSSRYSNDLNRTSSYASLRPDVDTSRDYKGYNQNQKQNNMLPPPPPTGPVRYSSQKVGVMNKLGTIMQEQKMEFVVNEINRKDELHKRIMEESHAPRWGV